MKKALNNAVVPGFAVLALAATLLTLVVSPAARLAAAGGDDLDVVVKVNPPPFDFTDDFYSKNGIDLNVLNSAASARFGLFRQTGPPAPLGKMNWVVDNSNTSPTHNNVRILATTGAYRDSDGSPDQFFAIIAFAHDRGFFTGVLNSRGIPMEAIVGAPNGNDPNLTLLPFVGTFVTGSAFEAYAALKQTVSGALAPTPCGTLGDGQQPCFPVAAAAVGESDAAFFADHLRQDWRITTNRTRLDGSAAFAYFGDNLLGMWVITYFWYTKFAVGGRPDQPTPTAACQIVLAAAGKRNGLNLDGTPIVHNGEELHFLEGVAQTSQFGLPLSAMPPTSAPCGAEGNLDPAGADQGAVWLVCPALADPTRGAITRDAFLDAVHRADGSSLDPRIARNFQCLQQRERFCTP